MRKVTSELKLSELLALHIINLCGHVTRPINHRGFYNLTKQVGHRLNQVRSAQVRLNDDTLYEFLVADPYWNRLIHEEFRYEPELFHFLDLVREIDFAFFDGGANWGYWSAIASSRAYGAVETVAYEPMPQAFDRLTKNASINGDRFKAIQLALAKDEMSGISMAASPSPELSAVGASLQKTPVQGDNATLVDATTLDAALENLTSDAPVVVKLDLEGVECEVIAASKWIDQNDCVLAFEDHGKDKECKVVATVLQRGWPVYFFHDNGRLVRISSVGLAAELKVKSSRGYNFFGAHPEGIFEQLLTSQLTQK